MKNNTESATLEQFPARAVDLLCFLLSLLLLDGGCGKEHRCMQGGEVGKS